MDLVRVAVLGDALHPDLQRWVRSLQGEDLRVTVLSFRRGKPGAGEELDGIPIRWLSSEIDMDGWVLGKLGYLAHVLEVRRCLREVGADVVVPYYVGSYAALAWLAGVAPVVPFAVGSDLLGLDRSWWRRGLLGALLRRVPLLLTIAPHLTEAAVSLGVPRSKIFTSAIGIEGERFLPHRCPPPLPAQPMRILSTRGLSAPYHHDLLLRAVACLREQVEVQLTVAGSGPSKDALINLAAKLGLGDSVRFLGGVPNSEIPRLLSEHTLMVSLVESDGVSSSVLEAMAVGVTPVVFDHCSNRRWIEDGRNGRLLHDLTPEAIARVLREAMEDLELRRRALCDNPEPVAEIGESSALAGGFREALRSAVRSSAGDRR